MADYQRILSYLYRYEKAEKKECFGFVKAEQKSGSLKLTIQIDDERLLQGMELKLCFYERQGESWQVWQLDTLITQEHKEEIQKQWYFMAKNIAESVSQMKKLVNILVEKKKQEKEI